MMLLLNQFNLKMMLFNPENNFINLIKKLDYYLKSGNI